MTVKANDYPSADTIQIEDFSVSISEEPRPVEIITKDQLAPAPAEKKQQTAQPLSYYSKFPVALQIPQGATLNTKGTTLKEAVDSAETEEISILQQHREQQNQLDQKHSEDEDPSEILKGFAANLQRQQQAINEQMLKQQEAINGWFLNAQKQFQEKFSDTLAVRTHKEAETEDEDW